MIAQPQDNVNSNSHATPKMSSSGNFQVVEKKPDHAYRTELPNIIHSMGLGPFTSALYSYLKYVAGDSGTCWQSNATIAEAIGMSERKMRECLKDLETGNNKLNIPLIIVERRTKADGSKNTSLITIEDIWRLNGDFCRKPKPGGVVHHMQGGTAPGAEGVRHQVPEGTAPHADKQEPREEKPIYEEEEVEEVRATPPPDSHELPFTSSNSNTFFHQAASIPVLPTVDNKNLDNDLYSLLASHGLSDGSIRSRLLLGSQEIHDAIEAVAQWEKSQAAIGKPLDCHATAIIKALDRGWKPNPKTRPKEKVFYSQKPEKKNPENRPTTTFKTEIPVENIFAKEERERKERTQRARLTEELKELKRRLDIRVLMEKQSREMNIVSDPTETNKIIARIKEIEEIQRSQEKHRPDMRKKPEPPVSQKKVETDVDYREHVNYNPNSTIKWG